VNSFVNEIEEGMELSGQDGLDRLGLVSTLVSTECLNLKRIGHFKSNLNNNKGFKIINAFFKILNSKSDVVLAKEKATEI
jgi:hypothetical protein